VHDIAMTRPTDLGIPVTRTVLDDPASCGVGTDMTVTGGHGAFAGASGTMRKEGRTTFTDPTFETSSCGALVLDTAGRLCALGL
jgi:hypothetical protein